MDQHMEAAGNIPEDFRQWYFQETVELERKKEDLEQERKEFREEKSSFEREKRDFRVRQEMADHRATQKERLLEMKQQILEEELRKLAEDKKKLEQEKTYYQHREQKDEWSKKERVDITYPDAGMFFKGVGNVLALKKRYKELSKIYHPDNMDGDTEAIQEINREYHQLKEKFS